MKKIYTEGVNIADRFGHGTGIEHHRCLKDLSGGKHAGVSGYRVIKKT